MVFSRRVDRIRTGELPVVHEQDDEEEGEGEEEASPEDLFWA